MREIMWLAIYSARRESEICRIEETDNNAEARTGLVRDAKHPTNKEGNHRVFKYTPEARVIAQAQPKGAVHFSVLAEKHLFSVHTYLPYIEYCRSAISRSSA